MWTVFEHYKGNYYLQIGEGLHSETLTSHSVYLCLYDNPVAKLWIRPKEMFHETLPGGDARFKPHLRLRKADPEDIETLLTFGFDAWHEGRDLNTFLNSYATSFNHIYGQRYLLENLEGEIICDVNTLRFSRNVTGLASLATNPKYRKKGFASLLLTAVMSLLRHEAPNTKFLLFSEIDPKFYEKLGFKSLPANKQHHLPSLAMGHSEDALTDIEMDFARNYF